MKASLLLQSINLALFCQVLIAIGIIKRSCCLLSLAIAPITKGFYYWSVILTPTCCLARWHVFVQFPCLVRSLACESSLVGRYCAMFCMEIALSPQPQLSLCLRYLNPSSLRSFRVRYYRQLWPRRGGGQFRRRPHSGWGGREKEDCGTFLSVPGETARPVRCGKNTTFSMLRRKKKPQVRLDVF